MFNFELKYSFHILKSMMYVLQVHVVCKLGFGIYMSLPSEKITSETNQVYELS